MALAENRYHRRRKIKEKIKEERGHARFFEDEWGEWNEKSARIHARTPKRCRKMCCGNPRKFWGEEKHCDKKRMLDSIDDA